MKVSVVIPTHNRPSAVLRAVQSVIAQTYQPLEIIIVDDGSLPPLEIPSLMPENAKQIEIKLYRFDVPHGACVARNKGVEMAKGDIIMFLDDDDTWEPRKIEKQVNVFESNPQVGLVYSGRLVVAERDREKVLYEVWPLAQGWLYPEILYDNLIGPTSAVAVRKSVILEAGGFDPRFPAIEDYELWIRCCRLTPVAHDGECHVRYTIASNPSKQISGQVNKQVEAFELLLAKYEDALKKQGWTGYRKIVSFHYFSIAKAVKKHSSIGAFSWVLRSMRMFPNLKVAGMMLPSPALWAFRRWLRL